MSDVLNQRARALTKRFGENAGRYDALVISNKRKANLLEAVVALGAVLLGSSGASGLFVTVNSLGADAEPLLGLWAVLPGVLSIVVALATAYLGVYRPREKQQKYGAASEACASVAAVAKVAGEADFGAGLSADAQIHLLRNLLNSVLTVVEAAAINDQPPLSGWVKSKPS